MKFKTNLKAKKRILEKSNRRFDISNKYFESAHQLHFLCWFTFVSACKYIHRIFFVSVRVLLFLPNKSSSLSLTTMARKTVHFNGDLGEPSSASPTPQASRIPFHTVSGLHSSPSSRRYRNTGSLLNKGGSGPDGMYPTPSNWPQTSGMLSRNGDAHLSCATNGHIHSCSTTASHWHPIGKRANGSGASLVETMWAHGVVANAAVLSTIAQPTLELTCRGHRGTVTGVCFQPCGPSSSPWTSSPSRKTGEKRSPNMASSGSDGAVTLWEPKISHSSYRNTTHRCPVLCCDASPRGGAIVSGGHNGCAQLWVPNLHRISSTNPASWSFPASSMGDDDHYQWLAHSGGPTRTVAFARDGSDVVYTGGDDKAVKCWDLNYLHGSGGRRRGENWDRSRGSLRGLGGEVCGIQPESAHGRSLNGSRFLGSFSTPPTSRLAGIVGHTNWIRTIAVQDARTHSSYFHLLASGGDDQCAFLWDTRTYQCVDVLREPNSSVRTLSFHPAGYALASGDAAGCIHIYDLRHVKGGPVTTFQNDHGGNARGPQAGGMTPGGGYHQLVQRYGTAHNGAVNALQFTPDGHWMISVGEDGLIHLWDVVEGHLYCAVQAHQGAVKCCRISADGNFFATGGADRLALVWQLQLPSHPLRRETIHDNGEVIRPWSGKESTTETPGYDVGVVYHRDPENFQKMVRREREKPNGMREMNHVPTTQEAFQREEEEEEEEGEEEIQQALEGVQKTTQHVEDSSVRRTTTVKQDALMKSKKKRISDHSSFPATEIQKRMLAHAALSQTLAETEPNKSELPIEKSKDEDSEESVEEFRFRRSEERIDNKMFAENNLASDLSNESSSSKSTASGSPPPSSAVGVSVGPQESSSSTIPDGMVPIKEVEQMRATQDRMIQEIESLRLALERLTVENGK